MHAIQRMLNFLRSFVYLIFILSINRRISHTP